MRAYVFTDNALASEAGQFVWLSINVEKAENAALREKLALKALPTYYVLDPEDERIALRWVGGATPAQLKRILADARVAVNEEGGDLETLLARADWLNGEGKSDEASLAYEEVLESAPENWSSRDRVIETLLLELALNGGEEKCAVLAYESYPALSRTSSALNVAALGLDCALLLPEDFPDRKTIIASLEEATRITIEDESVLASADDRSGAYVALLTARQKANDEEGAKQVTSEWVLFLELAASEAENSQQRTVYDSHRLSAYLELGDPARALPMLLESQSDFPDDYNPPARLAVAYDRLERWDESLVASDRALELSYGPRKLRIYRNKVKTLETMGEKTKAAETLREAISYESSLPEQQRSERTRKGFQEQLLAIESGGG